MSALPTDARVYAACRIKRRRATKDEMKARLAAIAQIVAQFQPCSVRQGFYQAEVNSIVEKTERGYEKVQRGIVWLRQNRRIPFGWISDATRWMRKPHSFDSIEAALQNTVQTYRRAVWHDAAVHVEFWIEKDALAGTIYDVTAEYDVPLLVARGYSSITFLHSVAEVIAASGKPAYVYHLGDWDPSGQDAADHIERKLREYAPGSEIHFEKLAVTARQITEWHLPTRPTKASDSRSKRWAGDSASRRCWHTRWLRLIPQQWRRRPMHSISCSASSAPAVFTSISASRPDGCSTPRRG
jgi:hypothetical protein